MRNLDANVESLKVKLSEEDLQEISDAIPMEEVAGDREFGLITNLSWKFANTPPKDSKLST